ncbi:MAG TPA: hypothetical protein VJ966_02930, partial [Actinomycetes bacterium]|nr:hypothetical protein [Actinomycetes bacterium]
MTISLVGSASAGVDSGSPSVTLPAGISNGDVVLAVGVCSTAQTLATPSGWTVASGWPKDSGNARTYLWTKNTVTSGDSGTSVTFTSSAGNKVCVAVAVYHSTNGFPANPFDVTPAWQAHSSGTSYVAPQVTSATAGCWGVAAFCVRGTDPTAWTPAAGLTERQDLQRVGSGATSLHLADSNGSVGGAGTAWGSFAETNISATTGGGLSLLLKENTTGGGGGPTGPAYPVIGLWRNAPAEAGTWRQVMDGREAVYGTFQGHWSQYHGPGSLPLNAAEIQAIQDGKRLHIFWKPYPAGQHWAYTAAGSYDATINQVAQSIKSVSPAEVWLTLHHEPENDTTLGSGNFSYSAYRGMWQRVRARFDANQVTNVVWVCVFMNSHANPSSRFPAAGDGMINLWGSDGVMDGLVDIISQQDYIVCSTAASEIAVKWIEDLDFLDNNAAAGRQWHTKPKAVTEWGADLGGNLNPCGVSGGERGTAQHRADTIAAVEAILAELADRGVVELRYFDARSDWIQDPPAVDGAAFQSLKDASEAGQTGSGGGGGGGGSPGPILAAGFSLANDGDTQLTQQISFTLPDGWQPGDYALVWLSTNSNPTITAEPVGWSLDDGPVTSANNTQKAWRYSRRLAAGDVDPTWTISQSVRPVGILGTYRGVDPTTPVHAAAPLTSNGTTAATSQPAAAVTTTTAEAVLVSVWLARWAAAGGTAVDTYADTYGSSSPAGTVYGTVPASHTADASASAASGANPGAGALVAHLTANPVAAGTYGPYTSSWPVAVTGITGQLALLPAATTPVHAAAPLTSNGTTAATSQ